MLAPVETSANDRRSAETEARLRDQENQILKKTPYAEGSSNTPPSVASEGRWSSENSGPELVRVEVSLKSENVWQMCQRI